MSKLQLVPPDQAQRDEALNTGISCIVQAPAGSGKTELLTQRFLKLLAEVDEPEQILAITFTRPATAEMRTRILQQLEKARAEKHNPALATAVKALARSEAREWKLLEQPQRLNIQTIDSLCMRIAHEQPLLARMGGHLQPQEDARALYDEAARRTLANLGSTRHEIHSAIMHLLALRDNNLPDAQRLISEMLKKRNQWLHVFPLSNEMSEEEWDEVRRKLEAPFRNAVQRVLEQAHSLLSGPPLIAGELLELARYACEHGGDFALLAELKELPKTGLVDHWKCLARFLIKEKEKDWRIQYSGTHGFPAKQEKHLPKELRPAQRMKSLVEHLRGIPGLLSLLNEIPGLPPLGYNEDQWNTLRQLFIVLRYAVAELRVLFAEQNVIDFVELGIAALQVLENPTENVLRFGEQVRHLLVDEFQDTSRRQIRLLEMLLRVWEADDSRTCFLVGDPMQSIYMFRQAEVELFEQVQKHGIEKHLCKPIYLSANFRSHAGLTQPLNTWFAEIFANHYAPGAAAVSFSPSEAVTPALPGKSVCLHPQFVSKGDAEEAQWAAKREAEEVLQIIQQYVPNIRKAEAGPDGSFTIAVLARARQHLPLIAQKLRESGIPCRSVEIELLGERQEIRDLLSLTRALLHPMDRIAWLSVLRAPWCGLALQDLHTLCGEDNKDFARLPIQSLIEERQMLLSHDGRQRLHHVFSILQCALENRYQQGQSLSTWVERTWHSLGGPLCLDAAQQENARVFFSMLDSISADDISCLGKELDQELERLFAQPDPRASERAGVQLMTIHKAKGLGFDVVIVPGLERTTRGDTNPLIIMLQRANPANNDEDELLIAPIDSRGSETHPLYRWVRKQREARENEELKRLFYVACTRARSELHLFGTTTVTNKGGLQPGKNGTLLCAAWPALETEFVSAYEEKKRQNVIPFPAPQPGVVDIAAAAAPQHPPLTLLRLPTDGTLPQRGTNVIPPGTIFSAENRALFERPEGGRTQRLLGSIVHALLERLSRIQLSAAETDTWIERHASAMLRAAALPAEQTPHALREITASVKAAVEDPQGRWLLAQHPDAQSEASWTGWIEGSLRTLRADRVFRAGSGPLTTGTEYIWVVDYKTTPYSAKDMAGFLTAQREQYAPQLALYGKALQKVHGQDVRLRFALYFPRLKRLEHWGD
jgi:ATP-dependent helicase/nuclease subunit A